MIVQCEACQTKFRLADEKIKPGGTKVRCSKCKEIFTVMPPEPEPEPVPEPVEEPVEETVDFSSMNMEKVEEEAAAGEPSSEEPPAEEPPAPEQETPDESDYSLDNTEVDFSALEAEMGENVGMGDELADEFSFADTSQPRADVDTEEDAGTGFDMEEPAGETGADETDFGAAFRETGEPGEFDFGDEPAPAGEGSGSSEFDLAEEPAANTGELDFSTEEPGEFSFGGPAEEAPNEEAGGEFSFGGEDEDAFSFDEPAASEEPGEFSFDEEAPFGDDSASTWDEGGSDDTSFDFSEPSFETEQPPAQKADAEEVGLQFGEIDFAEATTSEEASGFGEDDFSKATMEKKEEEPKPFSPRQESAPPPRDEDDDDDILLPPPPTKKKSSLSPVVMLLVLLLLTLGGAAGYLYIQEGTLDLNTVTRYLPFLKDYLGEAPPPSPGDRIGLNITGSSYVSGKAGQMLVIQGAAVNNHPTSRSAITVKGVLLDNKGKTLLQQTVFCGNALNDTQLQNMPFSAIEEAMNNQFGDSLSNMNVGAGAAIPFTIVFRNIPDGIANINVEVVDSKPGAG